MKTEKEIKTGLECCAKGNSCRGHCPYDGRSAGIKECTSQLARDALTLIPRWISVKERMPDRETKVLCFYRYPDITTVCQNYYYGNGHWLSEGCMVTHWMPLPEPPKEE